MVVVKEEPVSFDQITWSYFQILRWMGILPFAGKDFGYILTRFLSIYIPYSSLINTILHIAGAASRISMGKFEFEYIYEPAILLCGSVRSMILLASRYEYKKLIDECHAIWSICSKSEHLIVVQFDKILRFFFRIIFFSTAGICITFVFVGFLSYIWAFAEDNTKLRIVPFKWLGQDVHESPNYEIIFVLQNIFCCTGSVWVPAIEISVSFILFFTSACFRILQERLLMLLAEDIRQDKNNNVYEKLINCVRFHQRLFKLCTNAEKLTRPMLLVQLLGTGYVLSLIIVNLAGTDPDRFKSLPILSLCFMQLFMSQCAPEFLLRESEEVATAVYFIYTPLMTLRTQKTLNIILKRAQKPVETKAGGIVKLCLETFGSLMSSAISFIVVLRNFTY